MFPSSLQKNIRELDRQISLLETECENMEVENRDASGKISSKTFTREIPNKPSISNSGGLHSPKMVNLPLITSKTHSPSYLHSKLMNDAGLQKSENRDENQSIRDTCVRQSPREKQTVTNVSFETNKSHKSSVGPPLKVMESTDYCPIRIEMSSPKQKNIPAETSKEQQTWSELLKEQIHSDKWQNRKSNKKIGDPRESWQSPAKPRLSSAESSKSQCEKWAKEMECPMISQSKPSTTRRPRSARTRKKSDEVPLDAKALQEKEIQCIMWNQDREKTDFLLNLNDSIRTLHLLIDELKTKSTREKRNDVLNDMQNTLLKISRIKSISTLQNPLDMFCSRKGNNVTSSEGEENIIDQKKALDAVKKFCQELSEEKSALMEELNTKNRKITHLKNKEKEYLSLISNLKFNLERLREEAEENKFAKRDLLLVEAKLREGTKVTEALKKNHGKMQSLIEHYVLENDKLRTAVKMARLESQKFHVLLAGKDVEIDKYKQEIELFQKQITQQLSLLRSKAVENEVEDSIAVISTQANILQTEVYSLPSETTFEKEELSVTYDLTEATSSIRSQGELRTNEEQSPGDNMATIQNKKQERETETESIKTSSWSRKPTDVDINVKVGGFMSCKSEDSMSEVLECDKHNLELRGVLSSSKSLRSSIKEILQGMRKNSSEKFWPTPPNSSRTSQCSAVTTCSENTSECARRD